MTEADRPAFAVALKALAHGTVGGTSEGIDHDMRGEVYFRALRDLPLETVEAAFSAWVLREKFFPAVSEIRTFIEGSREDAAELAWLDLLREVRRVGWVGKPDLPETTWDTVTGLWGSWRHLCETLPGEGPGFTAMAKSFKAAYGATRARAEQGQLSRGEASTLLRGLLQDATREGPRRLVGAKR